MMTSMSATLSTRFAAAEAKAHFAELLRRAEAGEIVEITRYGKPVAAIVRAEDAAKLRGLRAARPRTGFVSALRSDEWGDTDELARAIDEVVARRSAG